MDVVLGQNLGQIRPNVMKKVKKQVISLGFVHFLLGEYLISKKQWMSGNLGQLYQEMPS